MSIKILKAIRLCIGSQCSSARMNSDICPNLGIHQSVEQQHSEPTAADQHTPALHQRKLHYNNLLLDKRMHEGPGSFKGQRAAYRTNLPQMVNTRATYTAHMPGKGQFLVQGHPQVPHSSGKQDTREA